MIILSPWSRKMRNGKSNPKSPNLGWWNRLVELLRKDGHATTQIGERGEELIGADAIIFNPTLSGIVDLINSADAWISVDNMTPHLVQAYKSNKRGIVIWGRSDPKIFGYPENMNLLKDRRNLKPNQFGIWEEIEHDQSVFVEPEKVIEALRMVFNPKLAEVG